MELTIAVAITIINCVLGVVSFAINRKKDAVSDSKESSKESANQQLIDYRLTQVEKKLDKIIDILDNYEKEVDERVKIALDEHIKIYHKG